MVCKMLFFDFKNSDKLFFDKNPQNNFEVKFFTNSLNRKTVKDIPAQELNDTAVISVHTPSLLSDEVINQFKNLRIISVRAKNYKHIDLGACLERNIAVVNIDIDDNENNSLILQTSLKAISGVMCGCKDYRVV